MKRAIPLEQKRQQSALLLTNPLAQDVILPFFSKTVDNLKDTFSEVCFINQLKQYPLRSKLHTNVLGMLFCAFSGMNFYAHSNHRLKSGSLASHRHIQDCCGLLLSPIKELLSSFLFFSNLKLRISERTDSLWGQYLWEKMGCFLVVLGHAELLGILKVTLSHQGTYEK